MLMATMGAQCMSWLTSPAATELEERVLDWLRDAKGLPNSWKGVIQDTASSATLSAILSARERHSAFAINQHGFTGEHRYRIYSSEHVHSSIDKGVKIAGIGQSNIVKVAVDEAFAMIPSALEKAIQDDLAAGFTPLCVVTAIGTTSSTAIDPIDAIGDICLKYKVWHHIDAAYAGTALLLPEYRWMIKGIKKADSYVFNPHKWMFTNFDCTAYYVKDTQTLINTFSMTPEYLKTQQDDEVNNYRDWHIQLGRRFRALKLWFVIRSYGISGIQEKLREHMQLAQWLYEKLDEHPQFELLAPMPLNTICFRYLPASGDIDTANEQLMQKINDSGKAFLSHTKLNGAFTIRIVIAQTNVKKTDVEMVWQLIQEAAYSQH